MPFSIKNLIGGGIIFSNKSFSTKPFEQNRAEKGNRMSENGLDGLENFQVKYPN